MTFTRSLSVKVYVDKTLVSSFCQLETSVFSVDTETNRGRGAPAVLVGFMNIKLAVSHMRLPIPTTPFRLFSFCVARGASMLGAFEVACWRPWSVRRGQRLQQLGLPGPPHPQYPFKSCLPAHRHTHATDHFQIPPAQYAKRDTFPC